MLKLDDPGIVHDSLILSILPAKEPHFGSLVTDARATCSVIFSSGCALTSRKYNLCPGTSLPAALSPVLSAEGALDAAAAARAAVRIHGLAVAWTSDAVFYVSAAPEQWEAVAAVLERGGRQHACGGMLRETPGLAEPDGGAQEEGGARKGARRAAEKATHGAKDQLKALAGVCSCEGGRCGSTHFII